MRRALFVLFFPLCGETKPYRSDVSSIAEHRRCRPAEANENAVQSALNLPQNR
jgi:hypothetical protein